MHGSLDDIFVIKSYGNSYGCSIAEFIIGHKKYTIIIDYEQALSKIT